MDVQAVLGLAPDSQVASSATRLASASGWQSEGSSEAALWGQCAGSGSKPYSVCVDLGDRATKCSCPSRKFPCKHALALQLRHARDPLPAGEAPGWVSDWLDRRGGAVAADDSEEGAARRAKAKEQTARKRQRSVDAGVENLAAWLADVAGVGIAGLTSRDAAWWRSVSARMVDAKAQGLAAAVDELRLVVAAGGAHWAHDAADRVGGLHLLARLASSPEHADVVRRRLGFSVSEEEARSAPGLSDDWVPVLKRETDDGKIRTVKQWVWGREHGWVTTIRHAAGGARPVPALPHGVEVRGVLHPYPGAAPRRVAVGEVVVVGGGPVGGVPLAEGDSAGTAPVTGEVSDSGVPVGGVPVGGVPVGGVSAGEVPVAGLPAAGGSPAGGGPRSVEPFSGSAVASGASSGVLPEGGSPGVEPVPASPSWREALAGLEVWLREDPWLREHPLSCRSVRLTADVRHLVDGTGHAVPVHSDVALDQAVALTGGAAFDAWGVWTGRELHLGAVALPGRALEVVG